MRPPSWTSHHPPAAEGTGSQSTEQHIPVQISGPSKTGHEGLLFTSKIEHYYWLHFWIEYYCIYAHQQSCSQLARTYLVPVFTQL